MAKKEDVIIHPNPDLDACMCVVLADVEASDVHFVPAGATAIPVPCPCCGTVFDGTERVLDHPLGEKGRLDPSGIRHAAAAAMPEATSADPDLIAEVEEQDASGLVRQPRFSLARILAAVRTEARDHRGLTGTALDREVVEVMGRMLRGLNMLHAKRQVAGAVIAACRIETVGGVRFAIMPPGTQSPEVGIVLNEEHDVSGSIYQDGLNLGVTRYPGRELPDLRLLRPHLAGWFVHTAGFLACWGSRKSPAKGPPPAGTPLTQDELLTLMRRVFG